MKVKVCRTGSVHHVEAHWLIGLLCEAGVLEEVREQPKPLPPCKVTWTISAFASSGEPLVRASCPRYQNGEPTIFARDVRNAKFCHCGKEDFIPAEVAEEFQKRYAPFKIERAVIPSR